MLGPRRALELGSVVLVIALTAVALTSCTVGNATGTGGCRFNIQYPHKRTSNSHVINVKANLVCNVDVTHARVTLKIQRQVSGRWIDVPNTEQLRRIAYVAAGSPLDGFFTSLDTRCVNGTYRGAARGGAYLNGRYSGTSAWIPGPTNRVTC